MYKLRETVRLWKKRFIPHNPLESREELLSRGRADISKTMKSHKSKKLKFFKIPFTLSNDLKGIAGKRILIDLSKVKISNGKLLLDISSIDKVRQSMYIDLY